MILGIGKRLNIKGLCLLAGLVIVVLAGCAGKEKPPAAQPGADAQAAVAITGIAVDQGPSTVAVQIEASGALTYSSVTQPFPLGVILYFPDTALADVERIQILDDPVVQSVKTSEIEGHLPTVRVEIGLNQDVAYEVAEVERGIKVSFNKPWAEQPASATPAVDEETETPTAISEQAPVVPPAAADEQTASAAESQASLESTNAAPARNLESIAVFPSANGMTVWVRADGAIRNYKMLAIPDPPRIVFDIFELQSPYRGEQRQEVDSPFIKRLRHFAYPDKVRLVIETQESYLHAFSGAPASDGLTIVVGGDTSGEKGTGPTAEAETVAMGKTEPLHEPQDTLPAGTLGQAIVAVENLNLRQTADSDSPPLTLLARGTKVSILGRENGWLKVSHGDHTGYIKDQERFVQIIGGAQEAKPEASVWVNRIDFNSEAEGRSAVVVGTTRPVKYGIKRIAPKRLQLTLENAAIPTQRLNPLITTRFESAVDRVTPMGRKPARIVIELREVVPFYVEDVDNLLVVHFDASTIPPRPLETAGLPDWQQVMAQSAAVGDLPEGTLGPQEVLTVKGGVGEPAREYTGEKIALDFYETDIKNVFRILKAISGKNFAIDQNVSGKVTISLEKPVPWDQVMDLVLKMNQLGMVEEGDIIRIASLETLSNEEELVRARLSAEKEAREEKQALEPLVTEYISINYSNAKEDILPHLDNIRTPDRGTISVDDRTNVVIMTDVADKIEQAKEMVAQLDKVTPQVVIEARIVEATATFSREIGTQWGLGYGVQPPGELPTSIGSWVTDDNLAVKADQEGRVGVEESYGTNVGVNFPAAATNAATLGFNFANLGGTTFLLNAQLMAMESEGDGKIISAPKIVTLDNKEATIEQGLEYPVNTLDESGNTVTEFKDIKLVLSVTPHVTPDDRISMRIDIEKNDVGPVISGNQSFTSKKAQTELLVDNGDTVVIGGIIKTTKADNETGLPYLSKIPILGWLFKTNLNRDEKEELLIFITPRIVQLKRR